MNLLSKIMPMHAAVAARLEQAGNAGWPFLPATQATILPSDAIVRSPVEEPQRGSVIPAQGCLPSEVLLTKEGEATLGNAHVGSANPEGVVSPGPVPSIPQYLYQGGAYGDYTWVSNIPPAEDQWRAWSCGELLIFKIAPDLSVYEPDGSGHWAIIKTLPLSNL